MSDEELVHGTISISEGMLRARKISSDPEFTRAAYEAEENRFDMPLFLARKVSDFDSLPLASSGSDLGFSPPNLSGGAAPYLTTGDVSASSIYRSALLELNLPTTYETSSKIVLEVVAGMDTNIADTAANLDWGSWKLLSDGTAEEVLGLGAASVNVNSLTPATYTLELSVTNLRPDGKMYVQVGLSINDVSTAGAVIGNIYNVHAMLKTRG